ncbi:MAG: hypothetical protein KME35_08555 [Aphanocapsa sp. GSE-SYN-MK-11-07L]|jgi:hypothetical protein|nr:hypothetical protein [Aphanocapsa sp. GSE-SYN-MK-11-07L]
MRSLILTLALTCIAAPAAALTCEESFQKKGDFFNGSAFAARVELAGVSIEKAFSQLRPILARDGIRTLSTDLTTGEMKAENPATPFQRALPIDVYGSTENDLTTIEMVFTLPGGVGAKRETVKKHLCAALNQLRPAGTVTATAPAPTDTTPIAIDASDLAAQVKESADNPARIRLNFIGKTFRVSGKVIKIAEGNGSYAVSFEGNPAGSAANPNQIAVTCSMGKNQDATVAALQANQRATLLGRFQRFNNETNAIILESCTGG